MLGETFTTAATPQPTRASALTRSRSTWSITATSPGRRRLVRFLVRRSSRTQPVTPGSDGACRRLWKGNLIAGNPATQGSLGGRTALGSGGRVEQLTSVRCACRAAVEPGEHPGQLTD